MNRGDDVTDREKFLEMINDFGIKLTEEHFYGKIRYEISDDPYVSCNFIFDECGKFEKFYCC